MLYLLATLALLIGRAHSATDEAPTCTLSSRMETVGRAQAQAAGGDQARQTAAFVHGCVSAVANWFFGLDAGGQPLQNAEGHPVPDPHSFPTDTPASEVLALPSGNQQRDVSLFCKFRIALVEAAVAMLAQNLNDGQAGVDTWNGYSTATADEHGNKYDLSTTALREAVSDAVGCTIFDVGIKMAEGTVDVRANWCEKNQNGGKAGEIFADFLKAFKVKLQGAVFNSLTDGHLEEIANLNMGRDAKNKRGSAIFQILWGHFEQIPAYIADGKTFKLPNGQNNAATLEDVSKYCVAKACDRSRRRRRRRRR